MATRILPPPGAVLACLALLAGTLLLSSRASGHALLVRSDPVSNASLSEPPAAVSLWFSEPLEPALSGVRVVASSGREVHTGAPVFGPAPEQMTVSVGELPPDIYSVLWKTASTVDGHLLQGSFPFTVLNRDGSVPEARAFAGEAQGTPAASVESVVFSWFVLAAAALLLGGALLSLLAGAPPPRYWAVAGLLALLAGSVDFADFVVKGREAGIVELLRTRQGTLAMARLGLLFFGGGAALWGAAAGRVERTLAALAATALVPVLAAASHAAAGTGAALGMAAVSLHGWSALAWPGALAGLAVLHRAGRLDMRGLARFSSFALIAAAVLLASGIFVAAKQLPDREALTGSDYGRALVLKSALAVVALLLATSNTAVLRRRTFTPRLGQTLLAELAVLALVFLAASRLAGTSPPFESGPSTLAPGARSFEQTFSLAPDLRATLAVAPNVVGVNRFVVVLRRSAGGGAGEVLRVRLRFRYSDPAVGVSQVIAEDAGGGRFEAEGAFLSLAGNWQVEVDVRRRGQDDAAGTVTVPAQPPPEPITGGGAWEWPVEAFSPVQFAAGLLGTAGLVVLAWRIRSAPGVRATVSPAAFAGLVIATAGFGAAIAAREEKPLVYGTLANPIPASAYSIERGAAVYAQNCANCHGSGGRGDGPLAPSLNPRPFDLTIHGGLHRDGDLFGWISDGIARTAMPGWKGSISEEDRWHLVNFIRDLAASPPQAATPPATPSATPSPDATPVPPTATPSPPVSETPPPTPTAVRGPIDPAAVLRGRIVLTRADRLVVRDLASGEEATLAATNGADFIIDPAWSPDGSRVAYAYQLTLNPAEGNDFGSDLYIVDADGANGRILVRHGPPGTFYRFPVFSPDGRTLYFSRSRVDESGGAPQQVFEIASLDLETGIIRVLIPNAYGGEISRDGHSFVFVDLGAGGSQSLAVLDMVTGEKRTLVTPDDGLVYYYAPRFSPDGSTIVFAGTGDIGTVPLVSLPPPRPAGPRDGGWDPLGLRSALADLIFGSPAEADGPPWDLYVVAPDGSRPVARLTELYDDQPHAAWSADGRVVLFIGITGLSWVAADRSAAPAKLADGLLHSQLDWHWGQ